MQLIKVYVIEEGTQPPAMKYLLEGVSFSDRLSALKAGKKAGFNWWNCLHEIRIEVTTPTDITYWPLAYSKEEWDAA